MEDRPHILIVDNDDGFRTAADTILRNEGYKTALAEDGHAALKIIRKHRNNCKPVDILLTDIRMPGMDGFDLISKVRQEGVEIPTIAVTAYGDTDTLTRLIRCNVSEYLAKPCTVKELLGAILSVSQRIQPQSRLNKTACEASRISKETI